jgi:nicotinamide-nucleotide amidase
MAGPRQTFRYCVEQELVERAGPVIEHLRRKGLSIVTAESCTAGLLSAILSHVPGVSDCLHGGFVVYTKEHKAAALGVDLKLLKKGGSVTKEIARQMAQGALSRSAAMVSLSVTGVLGPDPDEDGNPPGGIVFGLCQLGRSPAAWAYRFESDHPDSVRRQAVFRALQILSELPSQGDE